jgi:phenylacetyl-CoA:acceptor oxidoreductase subunit 2
MNPPEPRPGRVAPWIQTNWDLRAAGNFIGGGSGTGLLIAGAVGHAAGATYRPLALVGLAFVALGLFCVFLEIGRHLRAANVVLHPGGSWMTREAIVAPFLFGCGLAAAWWQAAWLVWLTALLAALYLYCQARILQAGAGIPAWREPRTIPLVVTTGLAEGAGLLVALLAAFGAAVPVRWPALALAAVLVARTVAWRRYRKRLHAPARALAALDAGRRAFDRLGNWVAAPIAVIASVAEPGPVAAWLGAAAGVLGLAGGWHLKITLITRAAHNQGFALPKLPVRGRGPTGPAAKPGW